MFHDAGYVGGMHGWWWLFGLLACPHQQSSPA